MILSESFKNALRKFVYFMSAGNQRTMDGIEYLSFYGQEPSSIEQVYAIFCNVIEMDEEGVVLNAKYAERRATDYLKRYIDPTFKVEPEYEEWETYLY